MNERKKQKLNDYAILRAAKIPLHQISEILSLAPITLGRWYMETEFVHKFLEFGGVFPQKRCESELKAIEMVAKPDSKEKADKPDSALNIRVRFYQGLSENQRAEAKNRWETCLNAHAGRRRVSENDVMEVEANAVMEVEANAVMEVKARYALSEILDACDLNEMKLFCDAIDQRHSPTNARILEIILKTTTKMDIGYVDFFKLLWERTAAGATQDVSEL